jgi:hypothetical protein
MLSGAEMDGKESFALAGSRKRAKAENLVPMNRMRTLMSRLGEDLYWGRA